MTNQIIAIDFSLFEKEATKLIREFYQKTNATELSEVFSLLLDNYIQHGEFERLQLANIIRLINDFQTLAFKMQQLGDRQTAFEQLAPVNKFTS